MHIGIDGGLRYDIGPRVFRELNADMKGSRRPVDDRMARDVRMTTPSSRHRDSLLATSVANLICSDRVSCACEPCVLSIPNGISHTIRDTIVVRITRPSSFSF